MEQKATKIECQKCGNQMNHVSGTVDEYYCFSCGASYIPGVSDPLTLAKAAVRVMRNHEEDDMQKELIDWANNYDPLLKFFLHHSPNGGKRNASEGKKFKDMGTRAGYLDLVLHYKTLKHNGLAIEMKAPTGRLTANQRRWLDWFNVQNYSVHVCRDIYTAKEIVIEFLQEGSAYEIPLELLQEKT